MSTGRELYPTFDPLEPIHNPVTETPAPAPDQPVVQYVDTTGKTYEEVMNDFVKRVIKDSTSNSLRNAALAVQAFGKDGGRTVDIVKYHDEPQTEAVGSEPVKPEEIAETPASDLPPGDKMNIELTESKPVPAGN